MSSTNQIRPLPLDACNVLIAGGTSGVGLETAIQFAEAGVASITINGRNAARGETARRQVQERAPKTPVRFVEGDCSHPDGARLVCETAKGLMGSVDVLVNSTVGAAGPKLIHLTPLEELPEILTGQAMAPILTSRMVLPWMSERGCGAIVNIASDAGKLATPGEAVIGAAMAAIIMFTRTLAMEGSRHGVRANTVTPSIIEGTATYERVMSDEFSGKLFGKAVQMAKLGVVNAKDMAALIVFLASPKAAKISGQAISCNGGISFA
jgi:NAD(P)-dependent dehydrogenase (short-subunit alcohol dehydrogenase family)